MPLRLYTVHEIGSSFSSRAMSLREAFTWIMAMSGRERWVFTRTARIMHLVMIPLDPTDPMFESEQAVDRQARNDIMAQVCAHGLGKFLVVVHEYPALQDQKLAASGMLVPSEYAHRAVLG